MYYRWGWGVRGILQSLEKGEKKQLTYFRKVMEKKDILQKHKVLLHRVFSGIVMKTMDTRTRGAGQNGLTSEQLIRQSPNAHRKRSNGHNPLSNESHQKRKQNGNA